jgi:hypothetical protein
VTLAVACAFALAGPAAPAIADTLPTRGAVRDALLARADLPAGYVKDRPSTGGSGTSSSSDPACSHRLEELNTNTGRRKAPRSATSAFRDDRTVGPFVEHSVGVWPRRHPAVSGMKALRSLLRACDRWTETDTDGTRASVRLARLRMPQLGDERVAMRVTFTVRDVITVTARVDLVAVRVKNAVSLLSVTRLPSAANVDLEELAVLTTTRLRGLG